MEMEEFNWSQWERMPSPNECGTIIGPETSGVYQIRNRNSTEFILFGESKTCKKRMKSLFPKPFGTGTRNNELKRHYILENWKDLEYRTISTSLKQEAVAVDKFLKSLKIHMFNT